MDWSREEVEAIVADYLEMLTLELAGQKYNKTRHRQNLQKKLQERSEASIEFKHGNISAVMRDLGFPNIPGYKPRSNYQALLATIVVEQVRGKPTLDSVALEAAAEYEKLATAHGLPPEADIADALELIPEGMTRLATVNVRVNQARFRKAVLAGYDATCCISGLRHEKLVIASHIVPWADDTKNRLNPQNGLCLSALHDRAYDQGLITVMPDFKVRVSQSIASITSDEFLAESIQRFDGQSIRLPERFRPAPEFLASHAARFGYL